jgi:branched-chain amino acid transport system permease protein
MQQFIELTLSGLATGMVYAALALALVLIWRGTRVLNYAQGAMAVFTSYVALSVINATGSYWLGFFVALAAGLVLGAVVERTVIRPVSGKGPLNAVIVTIGLLILIEGLTGVIYSSNNRSFPSGFSITNGLSVGSVALGITNNDLFTAGAVLAAACLLAVVFRFTPIGLRLRATAFNASVARLLGVRVGRMLTLGWALAGLLGALAGMLVNPPIINPNSMDTIFVLGFTAAVIGGLESPAGAVAGGLLLGVVLNYAGGYLGSESVNLFGLAALLLVLMLRPTGLFSAAPARRV